MRFLSYFLVVLLVGLSLGCGNNTTETNQPSNESASQKMKAKNVAPTEPPVPEISLETREDALSALNHSDLRVRWQAVSIIKNNPDTAFEDLKKALASEHEDVASAAASAIRQCGKAEEVVPLLIEALDHQFATVQAEAVIALGLIGPEAKAAIPAIEAKISNADQRFIEKAQEALRLIQE